MKKIQILLILFVFFSCSENPSACFTTESDSMDDDGFPKIGERISFKSCSENADTYNWSFGDGSSSSEVNPTHKYEEAGFYTISCDVENKGKSSSSTAYLSIVSLEGTWIGYIELNGTTLPIEIEIEQDEADEFDGEFMFTDDSGNANLSKTDIDENEIEFVVNLSYSDSENITIKFKGELTPQYSNISGECIFNNGQALGTWTIYRDATKSKQLTSSAYNSTLSETVKTLIN